MNDDEKMMQASRLLAASHNCEERIWLQHPRGHGGQPVDFRLIETETRLALRKAYSGQMTSDEALAEIDMTLAVLTGRGKEIRT